jgi:hypothetical protein
MHISPLNVVLAVAVIVEVTGEGVWFPRRARRLRDILKAGTGSHAETFAKQRHSYTRKMWSGLAIGVAFLLLGIMFGFSGSSDIALLDALLGVGALASGVIGFVSWRILDPPPHQASGTVGASD